MPYIEKKRAKEIDGGDLPKNVGEANYYITTKELIPRWLEKPRYETIHKLAEEYLVYSNKARNLPQTVAYGDWLVARTLAFLEFYARVGAHYEQGKMERNGDVYPPECFVFENVPHERKKRRKPLEDPT